VIKVNPGFTLRYLMVYPQNDHFLVEHYVGDQLIGLSEISHDETTALTRAEIIGQALQGALCLKWLHRYNLRHQFEQIVECGKKANA